MSVELAPVPDEQTVYAEFKRAAMELQAANYQLQTAQRRYAEALNKLNNIVAPAPQ